VVTGEATTGGVEGIPLVRDVRGGLLCDEPGLGKTVTCLAMILKTKGMMSSTTTSTITTGSSPSGGGSSGLLEDAR